MTLDQPTTTYAGEFEQVLIAAAPPALDHAAAEPLRRAVEDGLPNREDAAVVLDLHEVELITSIGIAALLEIKEFCADRGVALRLAGLRDEPREMLKLLRLESKFDYAPTVEDAVGEIG